ncbi:MAG: hypothetical protein IPM23_02720 [Candidatus Melainabacteria bacterium]|nr:hypothetical protein [Candidatus Melainabacteria bacterium]
MGKKISLDLSLPEKRTEDTRFESRCCRSNMVICPGYGKENFDFPTVQEAVKASLARLKAKTAKSGKTDQSEDSKRSGQHRFPILHPTADGKLTTEPKGVIPQLPRSKESGVDATLFAAAEGLRLMMDDGKYTAIVAERFDDHKDKVQWAKGTLGLSQPKYMPAIASLEQQLDHLSALYLETLPRVLSVLAAQNPDVPEHQLLEAAIDTLDQELSQILSVLRIWTDAFGQLRSGNYRQLEAVVFAVEQAFHLFEGEEPAGPCGEPGTERLKTSKFHVGNVFVARFSDQGPATLPASRGPIGAHAIEVPHDEANIITLMLALYMHEFRHDIFADVEGLAEELMVVLATAIRDAVDKGEVKLSTEHATIGRNKVLMRDLLVKMFADTIGEVDADISGGVLLTGPAYLYNMLSTFSAFNSKNRGVFNTRRLLRTGSYFGFRETSSGQATIQFWPHPPDYIRAHIVAAALDEIGFGREANQCRLLADQGTGEPLPTVVTWRDEDRKSKRVIKIPVADIQALAPVVARALIRTKLKCLGDLSTGELLNWNQYRQSKVDRLVENLMAGSAEVPENMGDIHATYVAAASTLAYWGLVKSGVPARQAAVNVDRNALSMIATIRQRFENRPRPVQGQAPRIIIPTAEEVEQITGAGKGAGEGEAAGSGEGATDNK